MIPSPALPSATKLQVAQPSIYTLSVTRLWIPMTQAAITHPAPRITSVHFGEPQFPRPRRLTKAVIVVTFTLSSQAQTVRLHSHRAHFLQPFSLLIARRISISLLPYPATNSTTAYNRAAPPPAISGFSGPQQFGGSINAPSGYLGYQFFPFSQAQGYTPPDLRRRLHSADGLQFSAPRFRRVFPDLQILQRLRHLAECHPAGTLLHTLYPVLGSVLCD